MINVFELDNGRLSQVMINSKADLASTQPVWVDLTSPTDEELAWVRSVFGITMPDEEDVREIEASARYYKEEDGAIQLKTDFHIEEDGRSHSHPVGFILSNGILFSVHAEDLPVFRLVRMRARSRPGSISDCKDVLLDLYAADAEYSADALEEIARQLEKVSQMVMKGDLSNEEGAVALSAIANQEDSNERIRRNMMDTRRAVSFLMRGRILDAGQFDEARQILRDIDSLDGHASFLFDKINFLMDTTVGFMNINQSKIIAIFSVAAVFMLPPTLIASIFCMNFELMPELDWTFGYPLAILLMLASALIPFFYARRRGWIS